MTLFSRVLLTLASIAAVFAISCGSGISDKSALLHDYTLWIGGDSSTLFVSTDGGETFNGTGSRDSGTHIKGISFANANVGWIVGEGFDAGSGTGLFGGEVYRTTNAGEIWTPQQDGASIAFGGIQALTPTYAVAYAGSNQMHTLDGGTTWNANDVSDNLGAMAATIDQALIWFICLDSTCGGNIPFRKFEKDGSTPAPEDPGPIILAEPSPGAFYSAAAVFSDTHAVVVGELGEVRFTTNSTAWSVGSSSTVNDLNGVAYTKALTVLAVGDSGTILRSTDGGATYQSIASPTSNQLMAIKFADEKVGAAVGANGTLILTTDGGSTWKIVPTPTTANLAAVDIFLN